MSRDTPEDIAELKKLKVPRLDLLYVDFYPLENEIAREGSTSQSVIEQTDIGGPAMVRSAVKGGRIVVCDPTDQQLVIDWLHAGEPATGIVAMLAAKSEDVVAT